MQALAPAGTMGTPSIADRVRPFEQLTERYEAWFREHPEAFASEVAAISPFVHGHERGLEVGVGSGRFAQRLGIGSGVEPSETMAGLARDRGVHTVRGVGEALPFAERTFDRVLIVVTLCYLDDPGRAMAEARRVLAPQGRLVVGVIDRASPLGERYTTPSSANPFYAPARFYTHAEVVALLDGAGFEIEAVRQTLFTDPQTMDVPDPVRDGHGEGAFLALSARPA